MLLLKNTLAVITLFCNLHWARICTYKYVDTPHHHLALTMNPSNTKANCHYISWVVIAYNVCNNHLAAGFTMICETTVYNGLWEEGDSVPSHSCGSVFLELLTVLPRPLCVWFMPKHYRWNGCWWLLHMYMSHHIHVTSCINRYSASITHNSIIRRKRYYWEMNGLTELRKMHCRYIKKITLWQCRNL